MTQRFLLFLRGSISFSFLNALPFSNVIQPVTKDHLLYDFIYRKCPAPGNPERQQISKGWEARRKLGMIANRYTVSSWGDTHVLKLTDSFTTVSILKTTELYTLTYLVCVN